MKYVEEYKCLQVFLLHPQVLKVWYEIYAICYFESKVVSLSHCITGVQFLYEILEKFTLNLKDLYTNTSKHCN